ncbi:MAG: PAS domain S-box protein [Epsilonproteobacteria bacterium]|nr:PAS domain S-box protein [Campylobacterota bacterium]
MIDKKKIGDFFKIFYHKKAMQNRQRLDKVFNKVSSKLRFLMPTFGLMSILIIFGALIISLYYSKIVSLNRLHTKVLISNNISNIIHSLQRERGLSIGYLSDQKERFKKDLIFQRKVSDRQIKALEEQLSKIDLKRSDNIFGSSVVQILSKLKNIESVRKQVDNNKLNADQTIKSYSFFNKLLLSIIVDIAKSSHVPKITQDILAYSHFLYLKEYAGIERARGVAILSYKNLDLQNLIKFTNLIAVQKQNELMFLQYSTPSIKYFYNKSIKNYIFQKVTGMENSIVTKNLDLNPKEWYKAMTQKLDIYDSISKYIEKNTTENILEELSKAKRLFYMIICLVIISFLVFIAMLDSFLKLAKEEQRLRVVMDKYVISSTTDLTGKIIDVSQAFCDISGYTKEELIGKPHNIVRHPDTPRATFEELWKTIKSGKAWRGKIKNLRKDGGFYWVYANVEPLYNSKGEIDSYIAIRLDITEIELLNAKILEEEEKNRVQEELMQQQYRLAQMGEMISMIAHQWRQPLSAITAATGTLILKAKLNKLEPQTAIQLTEKIKNLSLHLSSTIDDFRNFFKPNKTKNKTTYKKLVDSVLVISENSLKTNNIKVIQSMGEVYEFYTYENELKQVLLNLIKNAEDALVEKEIKNPAIMIHCNRNVLTIEDNAGGVPEDIMDKIFDPYFSTKTKKDGTGLGLYMSKMIIEDHCGGKLTVENSELGAVFKIILGEQDG